MTNTVEQGESAPSFEGLTSDGSKLSLNDFIGKKNVVLYFYPKDDTPGCTKEACSFRDLIGDFKRAGAEVLGISTDTVASHQKFAEKYHLPFPLLADPDHAIAETYGVWKEKKN